MSKTAERLMMAQKAASAALLRQATRDHDAQLQLSHLRASYEHQLLQSSEQIEELKLQVDKLAGELHKMRSEKESLLESGFVPLGDTQEFMDMTTEPLKDPTTPQKVKPPAEAEAPAAKRLPSLQSRLQEILLENKELAASLSKALSKINSLTIDIKAFRQANDRLETEIKSHKQIFAQYEEQLAQTRKDSIQMVQSNHHEAEVELRQAHAEEIARLKQQIIGLQKQQADLREQHQRYQQEVELNRGIQKTENELVAIQTLPLEALKAKLITALRPEENTQLRLQAQKAEEQNKWAREQHHIEIRILKDRIDELESEKRANAERYEEIVRQLKHQRQIQVTAYKAKLEEAERPRPIGHYLENLIQVYKGKYGPATNLQRMKEQLVTTIDELVQRHHNISRQSRQEGSSILRR